MRNPQSTQQSTHGCIIMASGLGTRFGGNKLIASLGGAPLAQYAIKATEGSFAKRLVVTRHAAVAALCEDLGVAALLHNEPTRNGAIRLGLDVLGSCQTITFVQADQPLIGRQTIAKLLRCSEAKPECIWRTSFKGAPGAPVLFPQALFGELRRLPEGKGGGFVAKNHPGWVRTVEAADAWELFDVDTQEDLRQVQERLASLSGSRS